MDIEKQQYIRDRVAIDPVTGCWNWQNGLYSGGSGKAGAEPDDRLAHRVSYEAFVGPILPGFWVKQRCNNRACCNPEDLYQEGRNGKHLPPAFVVEIKKLLERRDIPMEIIASAFKISEREVEVIYRSMIWKRPKRKEEGPPQEPLERSA